MRRALFVFLLFFCMPPIYSSLDEEIVVQLQTEAFLQPVYLSRVQTYGKAMNQTYLAQLQQVLEFDFNHNAVTRVVDDDAQKAKLVQEQMQQRRYAAHPWKQQNVDYVLIPKIEGEQLFLIALCIEQNKARKLGSVKLFGNIKEDRKQVHILADIVTKAVFDCEGIASTRILYVVKTKPSQTMPLTYGQVWEMDYDGANVRCVVSHDKALVVTPSYLPPKKGMRSGSFLYVSYRGGIPKIFSCPLHREENQRLSMLHGNQLMPVVSPQRNNCAFICDAAGSPDLFLQPYDPERGLVGKPQQLFSAMSATQSSPCFSPDGKTIAFVSNKDGSPRIYTIPVPKRGEKVPAAAVKMISKKNRESTSPAWSPDGSKIAYSARNQGPRQIWVYDTATGEERMLTQGDSHKENPSWAPNSIHLVFNTASSGGAELYLLDTIHGDMMQLTQGGGDKLFPCWEPRGQ